MPLLTVPVGVTPCQVEIPAGVARSCQGALHVRPTGTLHITAEEWAHVQKANPVLARQLVVNAPDMHAPALAEPKPEPVAPPAPAVHEAVAIAEPEPSPAPVVHRPRRS